MIYQIAPVSPGKTQAALEINRGLIEARRIQARLKDRMVDADRIGHGLLEIPLTDALSLAG